MSILDASATKLRAQIAKTEATLDTLKDKLAKLEAAQKGQPKPVSGLEMLWAACLPISRNRSSKFQCRTEWNRIPLTDRPRITDAIDALKVWNRSDDWKKDGNIYATGLHKWIKNRQWENLPDVSAVNPGARYSNPIKPIPKDDGDTVTDPAEIARLLGRKPTSNTPAHTPNP